MARKLKICNLRINQSFIKPFSIEGYHFEPTAEPTIPRVITHRTIARDHRRHQVTAKVTIPSEQENSIIFLGGERKDAPFGVVYRRWKRKFIEDLLLILSILTAKNVCLYSHRYNTDFPVITSNHLYYISTNKSLVDDLSQAVTKVKDTQWQKDFLHGFHLRMLFNHANIFLLESRFLSTMVMWELLYSMIKQRESLKLKEIVSELFNYFWPSHVSSNIFSRNSHSLISVLRNQLAHSGRLPIDRPYADGWMRQLSWETVKDYIVLFNKMSQAMVLHTLSIDATSRIDYGEFNNILFEFLQTGQVASFHR